MKDNGTQKRRAHCILVVDDEPIMRYLNIQMLTDAGYNVDGAEDGAVAWDTLQVKSYDLMITDNTMPKVSGVELIQKVRSAGIHMPIIMATAALPDVDYVREPYLQPHATLIKPYTLAEFLGTVQQVLCAAVAIIILLFSLTTTAWAEDSATQPNAVTISVQGKCDCSEDGVTFAPFERAHIFQQGAIIRTGAKARADLFFRRTGTVVRLQAGTEIKLEKMTLEIKNSLPVEHTLLDLRAGRIFTVVRSKIAGNTMEISNAAGRSVVEGSGIGRYIITADGTHVAAIGSAIPIKLIGETGVTIIAAGQQFSKKDGKIFPLATDVWVQDFIQLDELQAATEGPFAEKP